MATTHRFPSLAWIALSALVLLLGVAQASDEYAPGNDWATLQHASVTRTDKHTDIPYEVATVTLYGKRLANGAAVPRLLVLREKTAARCVDESCLYRYAAFALEMADSKNDRREYTGKPVELDAAFTRGQAPADFVVTRLTLVERTEPCGKNLWTLKARLEEGVDVEFSGQALCARPNPKFFDPHDRR
jgi:hypothetical protein